MEKKFKTGKLIINKDLIKLNLKKDKEFEYNFKKKDLIEVNYVQESQLIYYLILIFGILTIFILIGLAFIAWAVIGIQNSKSIELVTVGGSKKFLFDSEVYDELVKLL